MAKKTGLKRLSEEEINKLIEIVESARSSTITPDGQLNTLDAIESSVFAARQKFNDFLNDISSNDISDINEKEIIKVKKNDTKKHLK